VSLMLGFFTLSHHLESYTESEPEITPEYLQSLLNQARENARAAKRLQQQSDDLQEEDVIILQSSEPAKMYYSAFSLRLLVLPVNQTSVRPWRPSPSIYYSRETQK
jgi:hypothetical protein